VLDTYRSEEKPTIQETARLCGTTFQNVSRILQMFMDDEEFRQEKALRYSRSRVGNLNPMLGRYGSQHHNYKGEIRTAQGYLQRKVGDRYVLSHRAVMAEALGLDFLPSHLEVHHIDGDKTNNSLDNLALATRSGHAKLHGKKSPFEKLPLWHQWEFGTSKSLTTIPS
jgi:hypothetical protein